MSNENEPEIEAPEAEAEPPAPAHEQPAAPAVDEPEYTVRVFAQGHMQDPIFRAFVSCEERVNGTRKLPLVEWDRLFQAFKSAER